MLELIETEEQLREVSKEWKNDLGIDIECENNLHHYGVYVSIIQVSSYDKNWVVDVMKIRDIQPVIKMLENARIQKIFHDVGFDLRILHHQFKCRPKNLFDTQVAALLLGKEQVGLGSLLEEYFNIKKESRHQMADWTRRPLPRDMLEYAMTDTKYLLPLRDKLKKELEKKHRLEYAEEDFKDIERRELKYEMGTYIDVKGVKQLNDKERAIFKRLFDLRTRLAKTVDRPVHYVIRSKTLLELALRPPRTEEAWARIRGTHPIVRRKSREFFEAVNKGKRERIPLPPVVRKRYTPEQRVKLDKLNERRDKVAKRLGIQAHLILNKDQAQDIVLSGTTRSLRKWQKELLGMKG
ncbi:MAG: HRDC domain-containing protein [Candidatus Bathyarchaeota archaeon]|nr:HRDC domain-containing protein [Candidatus Bathyarchaeota archaeon]